MNRARQLVAKQLESFSACFPCCCCSELLKAPWSFCQVLNISCYLNPLLLSFGFFQLPTSNLMLSLSLQHACSHIIPDFPAPCSFVPLSDLPLLKITVRGGGGGRPRSAIVSVTECQRGTNEGPLAGFGRR